MNRKTIKNKLKATCRTWNSIYFIASISRVFRTQVTGSTPSYTSWILRFSCCTECGSSRLLEAFLFELYPLFSWQHLLM